MKPTMQCLGAIDRRSGKIVECGSITTFGSGYEIHLESGPYLSAKFPI